MAASSKLMITEAERRFPVRIRLALPVGGLGKRLRQMPVSQGGLGRPSPPWWAAVPYLAKRKPGD